MVFNREELAWAAGFFDGEGHTGSRVENKYDTTVLYVQITQKDIRPLERFKNAVGGLGKIYHRKSDASSWTGSSFEHNQAALAMLFPFLSEPKKEQAKAALTAYIAARN